MDCHPCAANSGAKRISPGKTISEGTHWMVEHAYPTTLAGWLVIVLKRHCENLHELTKLEWLELAEHQYHCVKSLNALYQTEREYTCCFAEMEGFKHIHFHVMPKYPGSDSESIGTKIFHHLKVDRENALAPDEVRKICEEISQQIQKFSSEET